MAVLAANGARVQEALRVLEDFGREEASELASEAAAIRYLVYDLEVDLIQASRLGPGRRDLPPAVARRLLGPERLIGRSTHRLEQLQQAVSDGCDYVGVGPVNATPTKPGREPVGLAYVTQATATSPIPCFAIGGIDSSNLAAVRAAGGDRVAVVRAITEAPDPAAATAALLAGLGTEA
jgi:thiamine-phosphate pyrophosphorylase